MSEIKPKIHQFMMKILPGYDATTRINLDIPIQYIVSLISECLANSDLSAVPKKDTKKVTKFIKNKMENIYKLRVPIKVDIHSGKNWGECK